MGALTENHKCPKGRFSRVTDSLVTILIGAVVGGALVFALEDRPTGTLVLAAAALGAVLANGVRQAVGPHL